jgi:UV-stimulated scaffold protein A
VQLLAFSIADELFMRSKLFRSLLADSLDGFLPLAIGFRRANPLPPPTTSAALLRKATVQALERWHHLFGAHYRQLRLAVEYLKESARVQFSGLRATVDARAAHETRMQEIYAGKVEQLRENLASIKAEIRSTIDEIRNGLEIICAEHKKVEGYYVDDEEEIASLLMRSIRTASLMAGEWVPETQENEAVFDALREAHRLLVSNHLVTVQEWITVLVRDHCSELGLDLDNFHMR